MLLQFAVCKPTERCCRPFWPCFCRRCCCTLRVNSLFLPCPWQGGGNFKEAARSCNLGGSGGGSGTLPASRGLCGLHTADEDDGPQLCPRLQQPLSLSLRWRRRRRRRQQQPSSVLSPLLLLPMLQQQQQQFVIPIKAGEASYIFYHLQWTAGQAWCGPPFASTTTTSLSSPHAKKMQRTGPSRGAGSNHHPGGGHHRGRQQHQQQPGGGGGGGHSSPAVGLFGGGVASAGNKQPTWYGRRARE